MEDAEVQHEWKNASFGHNRMGNCCEGNQGQTESAVVLSKKGSTANVDTLKEIKSLALVKTEAQEIFAKRY
jgi:hypothetical protein